MFDSMKRRLRRPSAGTAIGVVALAAALGGGAYAAIPGGDGSVKGCYATTDGLLLGIPHSKGDLRAIDEGATCRSYEKPLAWGVQGPTGPQGAPGEQGPQGDPGPAGPAGAGPIAYARIQPSGKTEGPLIAEDSMGVTDANVYQSQGGAIGDDRSQLYCFRGLPELDVVLATAESTVDTVTSPNATVLRSKPKVGAVTLCDDPDFSFAVLVTGKTAVFSGRFSVVVY